MRGAVRTARIIATALMTLAVLVATSAPAWAQDGGGDPSKKGELVGNLPFAVYLLIPLALVLALITALVLGPQGEPAARAQRSGRVSRKLHERDAPGNQPAS